MTQTKINYLNNTSATKEQWTLQWARCSIYNVDKFSDLVGEGKGMLNNFWLTNVSNTSGFRDFSTLDIWNIFKYYWCHPLKNKINKLCKTSYTRESLMYTIFLTYHIVLTYYIIYTMVRGQYIIIANFYLLLNQIIYCCTWVLCTETLL
jgi:hypothetical protein